MTTPIVPAQLPAQGFFKCTGSWRAAIDTLLQGSWSAPEILNVQGLVLFVPRIPAGALLYLDNKTALALAPRQARIWRGELSNINTVDTKDVYLASNAPKFNLLDSVGLSELVYDVSFTKVTFGGKPTTWVTDPSGAPAPTLLVPGQQQIAPFAFTAPTDPTEVVCLTDPALKRMPYKKPLPAQAPPQ